MSEMYDRMAALVASFGPDRPRATTLEVGTLAELSVMVSYPVQVRVAAPSAAAMFGIAVMPKPDLAPSAWRLLDQHGDVMTEGEL